MAGDEDAVAVPAQLDFGAAAASAVHDIKNSLGLMLHTVDTLIDTAPPAAAGNQGPLNDLRYEARRINAELVGLLGLFKLERGLRPLRLEEVALEELLAEAAAFNRPMLSLQGIELETRVAPPGAAWCFDRELVLGILNTVVNNTYRHARASVSLACRAAGDWLAVTVADDGPGYPPAVLAAGSGDLAPAAGAAGGTSLGLYFARLAAAQHCAGGRRGRIALANGECGGARFTLYLP